MRKTDVVILIVLLAVAGVVVWQQLTVSKLAMQVEQATAAQGAGPGTGAPAPKPARPPDPRPATTGTSPAQMEMVMQLSRHSDRQVRQGAILILGRLAAFQLAGKQRRRVRDQLVNALRLETDYTVLRALLKALEDLDRDGFGEMLLKVTATGSTAARRTAAGMLASKATAGMGPSIMQLMTSLTGASHEVNSLRGYLLRALQRAPYSGAFTELDALLRRGGTSSTRSQIVSAMAACATLEHGPRLVAVLKEIAPSGSSRTNYAATYIMTALARLGDIRGTEAMLPYLYAANSSVRRAAVRALGQLLDPVAAPALIKAHARALPGSSDRRNLERMFTNGYPGVRYQQRVAESGSAGRPAVRQPPTLVSSREMATLMANRAVRLKQLSIKPEQEL